MDNNNFNQQNQQFNNNQFNNQQPIYNNAPPTPPQPQKESTLGIVALIMCATGCFSCIGIVLAIVDVCKKDNTKKHTCSKIALIVFAVYMVLGIIIGATNKGTSTTTSTPEAKVEESVKEETKTDNKEEVKEEPKEEPKDEVKEEVKSTYSVGETVNQDDVEVTLLSVTESKGNQYFGADDGNVFLICEFEIDNNSSKDINVSSMLSFEAYCDDYSINQDFTASTSDEAKGKNSLDGDVKAGKKMNGIISYQVPEDWKELEINYTPEFWLGKEITFVATK